MGEHRDMPRRRQWYRPRSIARSIAIRPRVYWAVLIAVSAAVLLPGTISGNLRTALVGDAGALAYLVFGFSTMFACGSGVIRKRAARQDDSGIVILVLVLSAIALSFWTIFGVLGEAKQTGGQTKALFISLAAVTLLLSWLVTQLVFTFHYAHEYYRPDGGGERMAGGLDFPADGSPDYWDFLYFATSIGAASQTSDVSIRSKALRRLVTLHAVISFFFNTAVLALAINIGASLI
jgi:uncharacterized membrane protein